MAKYHGRDAVVYISLSGTGDATSVAGLADWSLDMATDQVEVTAFGDANKTYVQGLKDIKGTISGFWDNTSSDTLFNATESADGCKMYLYPSSKVTGKYWYGPALLNASIKAGVGAAVAVDGSFVASGAWGRK